MSINRFLRHVCSGTRSVRKLFADADLAEIQAAIEACERRHSGEIRFCIEHALEPTELFKGVSARDRAEELFCRLRVWDTEGNNGVLLYLLLADRAIEIVADRGIHHFVGEVEWQRISSLIEESFKQGEFKSGIIKGLSEIALVLERYFPPMAGDVDELPDGPVVL